MALYRFFARLTCPHYYWTAKPIRGSRYIKKSCMGCGKTIIIDAPDPPPDDRLAGDRR